MWASEVEYIDLEKGELGLGFSILDYQVMYPLIIDKHAVAYNFIPVPLGFNAQILVFRHVYFFCEKCIV